MIEFIVLILFVVGILILFYLINKKENVDRLMFDFIENYTYPTKIRSSLKEKYQHLTEENIDLVLTGLKQYFKVCYCSGGKNVSMPSQAVDNAWHEFILFTREYQEFCSRLLGRFIHHTPAEVMNSPTNVQKGIKYTWVLACMIEGIDRKKPSQLPLIFAIDGLLDIPNGFRYSVETNPSSDRHCVSYDGAGAGSGGI